MNAFVVGCMAGFPGAEANSLCNEGGWCITFTDEFRYLESLIFWDLMNNSDVQQRMGLASKAFGSLRKVSFCNQSLKAVARVWLFTAIAINVLLGLWIMDAGRWRWLLVNATISMFASIFGFVRCPEWLNWTYELAVLEMKIPENAWELNHLMKS